MGLGTGIFLMAVGAVLMWGVDTDSTSGFNVDTIGMILFVIGIAATLLSLAFWSSWGGRGVTRRTTTYDEDAPVGGTGYHEAGVGPHRTTVHEERRDSQF
jgi:hypothetical protein